MKQDAKVLKKVYETRNYLHCLDREKIHIIFFSYYFNFHNLYHSPLLVTTKLLGLVTRKPLIDHVAHISNFDKDEGSGYWQPRIFEASMARGMEETDLYQRLRAFNGRAYILTLDKKIDKIKAKKFEMDYLAVPYSKLLAMFSGVDLPGCTDSIMHIKSDGGFCSWLVANFLVNQGIDISKIEYGIGEEITPIDLFVSNFGKPKLFYEG